MINDQLNKSLKFLEKKQRIDGGFTGEAGKSILNLKSERDHQTVFFTALILWCLRDIPQAQRIKKRSADFLLKHKSDQWSWNYWQRGSDIAKNLPYPDDMDDTARAMLALISYDTKFMSGEVLGSLAKLLIASEQVPGGPYRTWLVEDELLDEWGDIDLAVNSSIGCLLSICGVKTPGLMDYLDKAIKTGRLSSPYYIGDIPIIYFLSAWYEGPQLETLKKSVIVALRRPKNHNALMLALLITASKNLGLSSKSITSAENNLLSLQQNGQWQAEALYPEPLIDGVEYYAGSAALTTAFAIEALQKAEPKINIKPKPTTNDTIKLSMAASRKMPTDLKKDYQKYIEIIGNNDKDGQITNMAGITAAAYGQKLPTEVICRLNLGSLNGWIAYTIYDDFLDDEGKKESLGVANTALRESVTNFYGALPDGKIFKNLVSDTFNRVDTSNSWEVKNTRGEIKNNELSFKLPDYKNYQYLAGRSWGHVLASNGVVLGLGYPIGSLQIRSLQLFFHNFLIARQLNDDAHDWEDDLKNGRLSAVVTMILADFKKQDSIDLKKDLSLLRLKFWQDDLKHLAKIIDRHIYLARRALSRCGMVDTSVFESWLYSIENATKHALKSSRQTKEFIKTFKKS